MIFHKKKIKKSHPSSLRLLSWRKIKYLKRLLSPQERKVIIILLILSLIALLGIVLSFYFENSKIKPAYGGKYTEALVGQPTLINPLLANNETDLSLVEIIFSSLYQHQENNEIAPDLAKDLPTKINGKEQKICLKSNLFWHDQKKITTNDILFTLELIKSLGIPKSFFENLKNAEIKIIDENCLTIKNAKLSDLTFKILPQHIWKNLEKEKINESIYNLKPLGSGAFYFASLEKNQEGMIKKYQLKANKDYHKKAPYLEEINFEFYDNFSQAIDAFNQGEVMGLGHPPQSLQREILDSEKINLYSLGLPHYSALFFNTSDPILQSKAIRQALAFLTPKEKILENIVGQKGIIMQSSFLPNSPFVNNNVQKYKHNLGQAQKILQEAGWEKGESNFLEKDRKILELTITTVAKENDFIEIVKLLQESWQELNIKVKLISVSPEKIEEVIKNRNFQIFLYGVLLQRNFNPYFFWHSSQKTFPGLNLTNFSHRRADELLEKALLTNDFKKQKEYYYELQEIIAENLPAVFLYNTTYNYFLDSSIKGIKISQIEHPKDRFTNIENWYLKTKRERIK
ncbi:peptide ABC transporter substrate-binding protein [Patescibacteria group bacterium]|nr:peptide ABC transporter substrate-binding protein [Patescibacteria group bacterium]